MRYTRRKNNFQNTSQHYSHVTLGGISVKHQRFICSPLDWKTTLMGIQRNIGRVKQTFFNHI